MIADLFKLISRRPPPEYERRFVEGVRVRRVRPRNRRIERLFVYFWIFIAVKSGVIFWAVPHYHIPFNAWWVVGPTIAFSALVTAVYFLWRE